MLDRPQRSSLFPYTTLFRSAQPLDEQPADEERLVAEHLGRQPPGRGAGEQVVVGVPRQLLARSPARRLDRKSTRLNSSHLGISYAVSCLKKTIKKSYTSSRH